MGRRTASVLFRVKEAAVTKEDVAGPADPAGPVQEKRRESVEYIRPAGDACDLDLPDRGSGGGRCGGAGRGFGFGKRKFRGKPAGILPWNRFLILINMW